MAEHIITILLPVALILVMIGVGMSLEIKDFKRIAKYPKAFIIGASCQLILLPLLAIATVSLFQLSGALAIGLIIISLCPGGVTSNLFTFLAKGDVGLSVSLTAVIGFITPFTIPIALGWALTWQQLDSTSVSLPVLSTIIKLFIISVLPVLIGMFLKHLLKAKAAKAEPWVRVISATVLALVILALYLKLGADTVNRYAILTGPACITLNLAGMLLGFTIAKLSNLNLPQRVCITMEVGLQNGTIALLLAADILKNDAMTIAPGIYSLWMLVPATAVVFINKRFKTTS
ncbi:MAG: bile acid:sodium symporter family protein [Akkermansiaceae bacterium]